MTGTYVSVIGAARSGIAAARLCQQQGGIPFVSDSSKVVNPLSKAKLEDAGISCEYGSHSDRVYESDIMVISPGVPSNSAVVRKAISGGLEVVSELEFASWFYRGFVIAVTGSNGKTTTTAITGAIFEKAGYSHFVGGNIGYAFSDGVRENASASYAILEVSSFQLDHALTFKPHIAVITNISPDHLERYDGSYSKYMESKQRIFANQQEEDILIYNYDDQQSESYTAGAKGKKIPCSYNKILDNGCYIHHDSAYLVIEDDNQCQIQNLQDIALRGSHNKMNVLMAATTASLSGISCATIQNSIFEFKGVEHRIEFVRNICGVDWYNDSKATNVESTATALRSFDGPIILIAGGKDKGAPYAPLSHLVETKVKYLIVFGESAEIIAFELNSVAIIIPVETLDHAVIKANELARSGDSVLLSPACASFDMFDNYEHRGNYFKELVYNIK